MENSALHKMLNTLEILRTSNSSQEAFDDLLDDLVKQINQLGNEGVLAFKNAFSGFVRPSLQEFLKDDGQPIPGKKEDYILGKVFINIDVLPKPSDKNILPDYAYRGCALSPEQIIKAKGYHFNSGETNLMKHQESTVKSIYISTTSDIKIAREFACQYAGKWVYKVSTENAVCVNDYFSPYYVHHGEGEVAFISELPLSQIKGVAWAKDWDKMATDFYPIQEWEALLFELVAKGIV
jgi:hypothetical protein